MDATASPAPTAARPPASIVRIVACALLLAASAATITWTVTAASRHPSVNTSPNVKPLTDPAERTARLHDVIGTFVTGTEPGDRMIVIQPDGTVRFSPVGPLHDALTISDTYQIGRQQHESWLTTRRSGAIIALDIDHLSYCGDTYLRAR